MLLKKILFISLLLISSLASAQSLFEDTMSSLIKANALKGFETTEVMSYSSSISNFAPPFNEELLSLTCDKSYEERMELGERLFNFNKLITTNAYFFSAPSEIEELIRMMKAVMALKLSTFRSLHQHCKGNPGDYTLLGNLPVLKLKK